MSSQKKKRIVRFIVIAVCVTIALCLTPLFDAMFNFGDSDLPPYQPDPPFEWVCHTLEQVLAMPLPIVGFIFNKAGIDAPEEIVGFLIIMPGLFWAFIVDFLLKLKAGKSKTANLPPTDS
jgi:hypothetical protein